MRKYILLITLPFFALDFATKEYIVQKFTEPPKPDDPRFAYYDAVREGVTVVDGYFDIVRVHNTGVAFGMANGSAWANMVFGGVSLAALGLIWWLFRTNAFPTRLTRVAVALLLSGIFGNLLDRLYRGYVVDFLHFHYHEHSWPSFNVADSAICVAAGILILTAFQKTPAKPADAKAGTAKS